MVSHRNAIRQQYIDFFNALHLDVILSPVAPAPAQPHETTRYWNYTLLWNYLDWPPLAFPTGLQVTMNDNEDLYPWNKDEDHIYSNC